MRVERAQEILSRFPGLRILVAGDLMLDEFVWGDVSRISPEAPVPVVEVTGESFFAGGAANVARNLREMGARAAMAGVRGADAAGGRLAELLRAAGIDDSAVVASPDCPTIIKTRVIARHQQVVRIDREQRRRLSPEIEALVLARLAAQRDGWDAVIFSDYAKGFLTPSLVEGLCRLARHRIITVDPSPLNPLPWHGVTAVKPNLREARAAAGLLPDAPPEEAAARLLELWDTRMVLITMGEHGMLLLERGGQPYHTPTRAREVFDVSGAGDTAIAVFTLALAAGAAPAEAAELANHASGVAVGKLGTATVKPEELLDSVSRMA
ncbi:MAG: PfkB family carbohydrate kinase [Bryobacteraceae bacterium]|nr:PfkB family carbohydrate kinase [Bryobacteraceae bacterium]